MFNITQTSVNKQHYWMMLVLQNSAFARVAYVFHSFKKCIQFLECPWNHEYFGSRANPGFTLTVQEIPSIHDSMNIPKIEFITYIYILYYQSTIKFKFSPNFAGFPDILN